MTVKNEINKLLNNAVIELNKELNYSGEIPTIKVDYPKEEKFGDYSTPFAMEGARIYKISPLVIGEKIKALLDGNPLFSRIDVVKPGFINFTISDEHLIENLGKTIKLDSEYGREKKETPVKYNLEFVSANPTGPLNIVSARAAAIGDTLANLIDASGNIAEREFYINDFGNQVFLLGKSVYFRYLEILGKEIAFPEDGYHGAYVKDIAQYVKDNLDEQLNALSDENDKIAFCAKTAVRYNNDGQRADMEKFHVTYQTWFSETTLHESSAVTETLTLLEKNGYIYEEDGKKLFRSTDFGDDKDRVVVRDDGRPTYLLADIAYHKNKIDRGFDRIIDIWGPDHHGYIARMSGAMQALGYKKDNFRVLISQQVNLVQNGEIVKMSKRLGNFSTMAELVDEIGVDVARYFFVMRSLESHLDFDLTLAVKESSENPVFYLQYAHARICSIFRKAANDGVVYKSGEVNPDYLKQGATKDLMRLIFKYPEEIIDAAENLEPHRICNYLLRLAQGYHRFYTDCRVLTENPVETNTHLAVCESVKIVLKNGLTLLGVGAPEVM